MRTSEEKERVGAAVSLTGPSVEVCAFMARPQ